MRVLPVYVEPIPTETVETYLGRLADAHAVEVNSLKRAVARKLGLERWRARDHRVPSAVEELAGLPVGALTDHFEAHGMFIRCGHRGWRPNHCWLCWKFAPHLPSCRDCALSEVSSIVSRGGAVCLTHRMWRHANFSVDVAAFDEYSSAEEVFVNELWRRGIALHTGELQLAASIVSRWLDVNPDSAICDRAAQFGISGSPTFAGVLLSAYPEVVRLAMLLTQDFYATRVLDVRVSSITQGRLLETGVIEVLGGRSSDELRRYLFDVVVTGHRAVLYAYGLRRSGSRNARNCSLGRALIVASAHKRACLLRHVEILYVARYWWKPTGVAPPIRVMRSWELQPDIDVLA